MPTICQFGKDYEGSHDDFVYHYAIRLQGNPANLEVHKPGQIDLMRVPKDKMMERSAYEYYIGLDSEGNPIWSQDLSERKPAFEDSNGVGWNLSVSYNAGLKRYLLCTEHDQSFQGNLGMFLSPC